MRALESVFAQSLRATEVVVVDDGSTDGTTEVLNQRFPTAWYPELRVLGSQGADLQPGGGATVNRGVSASRNLGIWATTAPWIAFLDSDDEWHPKKLEAQFNALKANREEGGSFYRLCHTDEIWIRNGNRVQPKRRHRKASGHDFQHCLDLCAISPSAVLLERSLLEEIGLFDESLPACEDYDLWLRVTHLEPVLLLAEPLVTKYGGHEDQLSRRFEAMDRFRIRAIEKLLGEPRLTDEHRQLALEELRRKLLVFRSGSAKRGHDQQVRWCDEVASRAGFTSGFDQASL